MKKVLKIIALVLALSMVIAFAACAGNGNNNENENTTPVAEENDTTKDDAPQGLDYSNVKVGFIFLHDPADSTYDNNFYQAALEVQKALGLSDDQVLIKYNIPEDDACYQTALELVDEGCTAIFADSFGHESYILKAAKENPDVTFCHATGTNSLTANVANYHNAFASIYEGRYVAGVVAGLKLQEMIENGDVQADSVKVGYVGAFPYAEVISGYTSWFLGVRSIVPEVTMEVKYTNSWFDVTAERTAALALIDDGCVLISQHADSEGAPKACEEKGVPNVAYNVSTISMGPTTALISSKIDWAPYITKMINSVVGGDALETDWTGTIATGSVKLTELNADVAAEGTQEKIDAVIAELEAGTLKVFDASKFTVNGETLDSYLADVEDDGTFTPETEAIADGYFHESEYRSAPYFDLIIDGITAVAE